MTATPPDKPHRGPQVLPTQRDVLKAFQNLRRANDQGDPVAAAAIVQFHIHQEKTAK